MRNYICFYDLVCWGCVRGEFHGVPVALLASSSVSLVSCLNRRLKKPVSLSFVVESFVGLGEESDFVFVEESGVLYT